MKKSVLAVLVLAVIALSILFTGTYSALTGLPVIDIPEPPPVPGMTNGAAAGAATQPPAAPSPPPVQQQAQVQAPTPTQQAQRYFATELQRGSDDDDIEDLRDRIDAIQDRLQALSLLPGFENRLNQVEAQVAAMANAAARLDTLQSQVDSMRADVENLRQFASKRYVEESVFYETIQQLKDKISRNGIISLILSLLALAIVLGLFVAGIIHKTNERRDAARMISQYVINYQQEGYPLEKLRMHLLASGWSERFVDGILRRIPK